MNRRDFLTSIAAIGLSGCSEKPMTDAERKQRHAAQIINYISSHVSAVQMKVIYANKDTYLNAGSDFDQTQDGMDTVVSLKDPNLRFLRQEVLSRMQFKDITPLESAIYKGWDSKSLETLVELGAKPRAQTFAFITMRLNGAFQANPDKDDAEKNALQNDFKLWAEKVRNRHPDMAKGNRSIL